ncbi:Cylicin-2, partial [Ophiophagus hannah]
MARMFFCSPFSPSSPVGARCSHSNLSWVKNLDVFQASSAKFLGIRDNVAEPLETSEMLRSINLPFQGKWWAPCSLRGSETKSSAVGKRLFESLGTALAVGPYRRKEGKEGKEARKEMGGKEMGGRQGGKEGNGGREGGNVREGRKVREGGKKEGKEGREEGSKGGREEMGGREGNRREAGREGMEEGSKGGREETGEREGNEREAGREGRKLREEGREERKERRKQGREGGNRRKGRK